MQTTSPALDALKSQWVAFLDFCEAIGRPLKADERRAFGWLLDVYEQPAVRDELAEQSVEKQDYCERLLLQLLRQLDRDPPSRIAPTRDLDGVECTSKRAGLSVLQGVQLGYERAGWFLDPALGGGGPYTGRATHMADLVPWLIDRQPTRLRSRLRTTSPTRSDHGGFIELQFSDIECQMTCIEEGWHMWDEIRIFGDDGLIELRRPLTLPIGWQMTWLSQRMERREELDADPRPGDATRDFVSALRNNTKPACTFTEAVPSVTIVELAFRSAREDNRWIDVP